MSRGLFGMRRHKRVSVFIMYIVTIQKDAQTSMSWTCDLTDEQYRELRRQMFTAKARGSILDSRIENASGPSETEDLFGFLGETLGIES